jgi:hypothetical protein
MLYVLDLFLAKCAGLGYSVIFFCSLVVSGIVILSCD